jgi:hypothetical protein
VCVGSSQAAEVGALAAAGAGDEEAHRAGAGRRGTRSKQDFLRVFPARGDAPLRLFGLTALTSRRTSWKCSTPTYSRDGVQVARPHHVSFSVADAGEAERVQTVMNGELPIVIVRGRAKANPTLAEVMAEYRATGR